MDSRGDGYEDLPFLPKDRTGELYEMISDTEAEEAANNADNITIFSRQKTAADILSALSMRISDADHETKTERQEYRE